MTLIDATLDRAVGQAEDRLQLLLSSSGDRELKTEAALEVKLVGYEGIVDLGSEEISGWIKGQDSH